MLRFKFISLDAMLITISSSPSEIKLKVYRVVILYFYHMFANKQNKISNWKMKKKLLMDAVFYKIF